MKEVISGRAAGPYSPAVIAGGFCFVAGQGGMGGDGKIVDGIEAQTRQTLENIKGILAKAGLDMDAIVRCGVFLQSMDDFGAMNDVYATFFPNDPPARTTIEAARLPLGLLVEIDCVAVVG